MELLTTIVVVLIGVALVGWFSMARDGRGLDAFGLAFLGYRSYGWPHGVQEEDAVHFAPTAWHERRSADDDGPGTLADPELVELEATSPSVTLERLR